MAAISFRPFKSFPDDNGQTLCQNKPKLGNKIEIKLIKVKFAFKSD